MQQIEFLVEISSLRDLWSVFNAQIKSLIYWLAPLLVLCTSSSLLVLEYRKSRVKGDLQPSYKRANVDAKPQPSRVQTLVGRLPITSCEFLLNTFATERYFFQSHRLLRN